MLCKRDGVVNIQEMAAHTGLSQVLFFLDYMLSFFFFLYDNRPEHFEMLLLVR